MINRIINLKNYKLFRYFFYLLIGIYLILLFSVVLKVQKYSFENQGIIANDFIAYYTGSVLVVENPNTLYDFSRQLDIQTGIMDVTIKTFLPYVYPPFTAYLTAPLILLEFKQANLVWTILNINVLLIFLFAVFKYYKSYDWWIRISIITMIAVFPAIKANFGLGQISLFIGLGVLFSWFLYLKNKDFLSGLVLSVFFIKLQYLPLPLIILSVHRNLKMLFGFLTGVFFMLFVSFFTTGLLGLNNYLLKLLAFNKWMDEFSRDFDYHINIQSGISHIFGIGESISSALYISISFIILIFTVYVWFIKIDKKKYAARLRWVLLLLTVLLLSPHTNLQDFVFVVIAFIILVPKNIFEFNKIPKSIKLFIISIFPVSLLLLNYSPVLKIIYLIYLIVFIVVLIYEIVNSTTKLNKIQKHLASGN